jgi:DNA-binding NtrC family response regulator
MDAPFDDSTRSLTLQVDEGFSVSLQRGRLLVEEGPDQGLEFLLPEGPAILGRGQEADLRLEDPSVSRAHARILPCHRGWLVEDLGSRSGTFLQGKQVQQAPLEDNVTLRLGSTELTFRTGREEYLSSPEEDAHFEGLLGMSPVMRRTFGLIRKLATLDVPVLLYGESGTGKESLAHALHSLGLHPQAPYEIVDCTLLEREHLRSELFGHVRGAFTGASEDRRGAFERASGGTLVLDEIAELPLAFQPALLRVLEQGEVRPLGANHRRKVQVRVVSSTNRDLSEMVQAGTFRGDLFYRLSGISVPVPSLRERPEDILLLADHFLPEGIRLSPGAQEKLLAHSWPGNVRELKNSLKVAAHLAQNAWIQGRDVKLLDRSPPSHSEPSLPESAPLSSPSPERIRTAVQEKERESILSALEACEGNQVQAAKQLGINRSTLYRKMKRLGLRSK